MPASTPRRTTGASGYIAARGAEELTAKLAIVVRASEVATVSDDARDTDRIIRYHQLLAVEASRLDGALADIRAQEAAGKLTTREAADKRIAVLELHLTRLRLLSTDRLTVAVRSELESRWDLGAGELEARIVCHAAGGQLMAGDIGLSDRTPASRNTGSTFAR